MGNLLSIKIFALNINHPDLDLAYRYNIGMFYDKDYWKPLSQITVKMSKLNKT